jgi:hypothetical protein
VTTAMSAQPRLLLLGIIAGAAAAGAAGGPPAAEYFSCGEGCTARIEPWCADGLRVRMFPDGGKGTQPAPERVAGALQPNSFCGGRSSGAATAAAAAVAARSSAARITNGGISASWADGTLRFSHAVAAGSGGRRPARDEEFLTSAGPIATAFSLRPRASPAGPPPPHPPYACQDSCTLGATGVREKTDADSCQSAGKILNVSRAACCAACGNHTDCVAWAWGRDSADAGHRHNCYMCSSLSGTVARPTRDFGCVVRPSSSRQPRQPPPPPLPRRTNYSYFSIAGNFTSSRDEVIVGLGQRSYVGSSQPGGGVGCTGGSRCGQWKLSQKGFSWPLGMTK